MYNSAGVSVVLFKELKALSEEQVQRVPVLCGMWGLLLVWI